jgi:DNA repair protein RadA/Sms
LLLIGGDPGIGKSTLVAQIAGKSTKTVLYVSGEESASQIKLRLDRLAIPQEQIQFLGEEHVEVICKTILETKPSLVIIDSIQTVASSAVDGEPGSTNQIKASTVRFLEVAKESNVPIVLIGHVTKGGELGGPKTLEHIVDVVLYLEGDRQQQFRLLRAVKNRFGSTNEVGVFEMHETGLEEVLNPSERFLHDRSFHAGTVVTAVLEGSRVFLIEVQALVNKTSFGFPQRKASGFDLNRLQLLLAVLDRRASISFETSDVYINVVGGGRIAEPSMDLAVCLALVSALRDVAISKNTVAWGEVGLGGEVRAISRERDRAKEAKRFGLSKVVSPENAKTLRDAIGSAGLGE